LRSAPTTLILVAVFAGSAAAAAPPAAAPVRHDLGARAAVAVVRAYDAGFRASDASAVAATVAPDVEWTNAVGIRIRGRARLRNFLWRLFGRPELSHAKDSPLRIDSARLAGPTVAVISSSIDTTGQVSQTSGKPIVLRRTHEMSVVQNFNGRWLIVCDLISDEARDL
jgi:uncharacterized protein (TIGR02246 family)